MTNYMEQSPWEANSYPGGEGIPRLWSNPKFHDFLHKIPPLVPIMSHMSPVHTLPNYFCKIHSNITLRSRHTLSKWPLIFRISDLRFYAFPNSLYATCLTHPLLLDVITLTMFGGEYKLWYFLYNFHHPVSSIFLSPHILLSNQFSDTIILFSSVSVTDQVSQQKKTICKILHLSILIVKCLWNMRR